MIFKLLSKATFVVAGCVVAISASAQQLQKPSVQTISTFAIVVDNTTFNQAKKEINDYKTALEKEGLGTYIISHDWKSPDEIRTILKGLYEKSPKLEGAVFVGDVPIPMIRDAQHLTSAFKMNQKINWQKSSVPSDRFYDDFNMQFDFIKRDSLKHNFFYYSLKPSSAQKISMSIYSGRIKPPTIKGQDKYESIRQYLRKVVADKAITNKLDDAFFSMSHGYNSESLNSWAGEQIALRSQLPDLFKQGNSVKFMQFQIADFFKENILSELKRDGTDMAILSGHGSDDLQLINGLPDVSSPTQSIENIKYYLRSKVQSAERKKQDVNKVKEGFVKSLGVPMAWMDNALEAAVIASDSVYNHNLDIHMEDVYEAKPNTRFVVLNSCLNGSFQLDDYIAAYYPFSQGHNIATVANSIGVLQDIWPNELLGILQYGTRIGNWFKLTAHLETHIFGDPTFHFSAKNSPIDLNKAMVMNSGNTAFWTKLLTFNNPDVQALALVYLAKSMPKAQASVLLKKTYFNSPYETTRMEAFKQLKALNTPDFVEVVKAAVDDPYEYIRRFAAYQIPEMGSNELIPYLVKLSITDRHSTRVNYKIRSCIGFMDCDAVIKELTKQYTVASNLRNYKAEGEKLIKEQKYNEGKAREAEKTFLNKSLPVKERLGEIIYLRNYRHHSVVPQVIGLIEDKNEDLQLKVAAIEALGWFSLSYQRPLIFKMCDQVMADQTADPKLKAVALQTKNRLFATIN